MHKNPTLRYNSKDINFSQAFWWQLRSCFEYVNLRPSVKGLIVNTCLEVRAIQDKIIIRLSSKNLNKIPRKNNVMFWRL